MSGELERARALIDDVDRQMAALFEQRMAAVGEGNLPFGKILKLLQRLGTTRYLLVEQDNCYGENPFDCLSRSYSNLKKEGYA